MRLRATTRIRNDAMIAAREALGLSQDRCAEFADVPVGVLRALEALDYSSPHAEECAVRLAAALELPTNAIMTDDVAGQRLPSTFVQVRDVDTRALLAGADRTGRFILPSPAETIESAEMVEALRAAINSLPKRRRVAAKMDMRGWTFRRIGRWLHVTVERARQIVMTGRRQLARKLGGVERLVEGD